MPMPRLAAGTSTLLMLEQMAFSSGCLAQGERRSCHHLRCILVHSVMVSQVLTMSHVLATSFGKSSLIPSSPDPLLELQAGPFLWIPITVYLSPLWLSLFSATCPHVLPSHSWQALALSSCPCPAAGSRSQMQTGFRTWSWQLVFWRQNPLPLVTLRQGHLKK